MTGLCHAQHLSTSRPFSPCGVPELRGRSHRRWQSSGASARAESFGQLVRGPQKSFLPPPAPSSENLGRSWGTHAGTGAQRAGMLSPSPITDKNPEAGVTSPGHRAIGAALRLEPCSVGFQSLCLPPETTLPPKPSPTPPHTGESGRTTSGRRATLTAQGPTSQSESMLSPATNQRDLAIRGEAARRQKRTQRSAPPPTRQKVM